MLDRGFLTLVALGAVAAVLFTGGLAVRNERDQLKAWATTRCAAAGEPFAPADGDRARPGAECATRIDQLARFERETNAGTAQVLREHLAEQNQKTNTDAAKARAAAEAAAAATKRMEAANAAVENDQVGGDWFGALNQSAGLRPPQR